MFATRTGNFPIGLRRGWSHWTQDLAGWLGWCKRVGIHTVDLGNDGPPSIHAAKAAKLSLGSVDIAEFRQMISDDAGKRSASVEKNIAYINACCDVGAKHFFCVMLPEKPELPRAENFKHMVESFGQLAPVLEKHGADLVIEGYPGPGALCCTPEGYRAFFADVPSPSMAINYDPSHLIRLGIDHIRFLEEFIDRVKHVHAKDAEVAADKVYEFGIEQPTTFATNPPFGGPTWRYTLPGHGSARWNRIFEILHHHNYQGAVSIELEDMHFNGTTEGEQHGALISAQFLASA